MPLFELLFRTPCRLEGLRAVGGLVVEPPSRDSRERKVIVRWTRHTQLDEGSVKPRRDALGPPQGHPDEVWLGLQSKSSGSHSQPPHPSQPFSKKRSPCQHPSLDFLHMFSWLTLPLSDPRCIVHHPL